MLASKENFGYNITKSIHMWKNKLVILTVNLYMYPDKGVG